MQKYNRVVEDGETLYESAKFVSIEAQKNKCLVSGNPTDPTFLGPILNCFGTSENFSLILGYFK